MKKDFTYTSDEYIKNYTKYKNQPLKMLISLYQGHGKEVAATFALMTAKESVIWILPIITANIINFATYMGKYSISYFIANMLLSIAFLILNFLAAYGSTVIYEKLTRNIEQNLRSSLVRKLQQLSISFHTEMQSGRLQSKIIRDVDGVETVLKMVMQSVLFAVLDLVVILCITMRKPIVLIFFLLTIPVSVATIQFFRRPIASKNRSFRKEMEQTQAMVAEMLELIPVTRAHGLEQYEIKKMDRQLSHIKEAGYRLDILNSLFGTSGWVVFQMFQLLCLGFTGWLAYRGKLAVGEVVLYQTYFSNLVGKINGLMTIYPQISKGMESINSIGEILLADDIENHSGTVELTDLNGEVQFSHIDFQYQEGHKILDDFNFKVQPGETIAFVGGSGEGKTTILNLLIGFLHPQKGEIRIDGVDLKNLDIQKFRHQIAMVPQNTILFSGTIRDNISYGVKNATKEQVNQVLQEVGLEDVISEMPEGIDTAIGEHGGRLSGGQRQRIAIARAMIRDPKMIIFDEATSALDTISEKKVQEATAKLTKNRTTFIVAHRLSTIQDADRIVVMENGKAAEVGNYQELMQKKGKFYQLRMIQEG